MGIPEKALLKSPHIGRLPALRRKITECERCRRLVLWRRRSAREKIRRYAECDYWGKPVPGFGDPDARLLLVGLAPAAHGGNRTGRMFTGDRSGDWLYRALFKAGFASQPESVSATDGLVLTDCYITAACRCAPPQNKLLPEELRNCRPFLINELFLLPNVSVIVGLGRIGFDAVFDAVREIGWMVSSRRPAFKHGTEVALTDRLTLIGSFHPSQQNTFTGRLTEEMFDAVFRQAAYHLQRTTTRH